MNDILFKLENVRKSFSTLEGSFDVLKGVNLEVRKGEFLIIFGPSGCGKSTLLHIMLGIEKETLGSIYFLGEDICQKTEDEKAEIRKRKIGMVYQQPTWVTSLSVLENVFFPLTLQGYLYKKASVLGLSALAHVNMQDWKDHFPQELSAGQQQKVGFARAIVSRPIVLIADEPTGNLDIKSSDELMALFEKQNKEFQRTIIMVTHNINHLNFADRVAQMVDGQIIAQYSSPEEKEQLFKNVLGGHKIPVV